MIYRDFYCPVCNKIYEHVFDSIQDYEDRRISIVCENDNCSNKGKIIIPYFGSKVNIHIPEYMRATSEDARTYEYAKNVMTRGKRPSGREKIYY